LPNSVTRFDDYRGDMQGLGYNISTPVINSHLKNLEFGTDTVSTC